MKIRLTESEFKQMVIEAVNEIMGNSVMEKLYNKIISLIEPIQDNEAFYNDSTVDSVSTLHYDVSYNGQKIRIKRTEKEMFSNDIFTDVWILIPRNWRKNGKMIILAILCAIN